MNELLQKNYGLNKSGTLPRNPGKLIDFNRFFNRFELKPAYFRQKIYLSDLIYYMSKLARFIYRSEYFKDVFIISSDNYKTVLSLTAGFYLAIFPVPGTVTLLCILVSFKPGFASGHELAVFSASGSSFISIFENRTITDF
jgi:hypothetical protein